MYRMKVSRFFNRDQGERFNVSFSPVSIRQKKCNYFRPRNVTKVFCPKRLYHVTEKSLLTFRLVCSRSFRVLRPQSDRDRCSILRSVRNVRMLGLCNEWEYFVTFTLSPKKVSDRSSYETVAKKITRYFRDHYDNIKYVLIPELHSDHTNYHFHGLMSGIPKTDLQPHPHKHLANLGCFVWQAMEDHFGFTCISSVKNTGAVAYYCLKYVNKDIFVNKQNDHKRLYYRSPGLNIPEIVYDDFVDVTADMLAQFMNVTDYTSAYLRDVPGEYVKSVFEGLFFVDVTDLEEGEKNVFSDFDPLIVSPAYQYNLLNKEYAYDS